MLPENKIIAGDCRVVLRGFPGNSIAACVTDPPYNYEFIGHKWDTAEIKRRLERIQESKTLVKNIPYGSGLAGGVRNKRWYEKVRQNILDYESWCYEWGQEVFRVCKPGALVAVFNSTRTMAHVQVALERAGFYARDCLVYRRPSGIPKGLNVAKKLEKTGVRNSREWSGWHSCLRNEWEAIVLVQKPLINNYIDTLNEYGVGLLYTDNPDGSFQSNILEGFARAKEQESTGHCTTKPLALIEKLVQMLVPKSPSNVVLDPFAGSGTTLLACKNLGIPYVGIEISQEYVELAKKRLNPKARTKVILSPDPLGELSLALQENPEH